MTPKPDVDACICWVNHARAKAPWTCPCECHRAVEPVAKPDVLAWARECAEAIYDAGWNVSAIAEISSLIDSHARPAMREIVEGAMDAIRSACGMCDGKGNVADSRTEYGHVCGGDERACQTQCPVEVEVQESVECEYCGRPMAAIRERFAEILREEGKP